MHLEQGDLIEVDFNPVVGHEPAKTRPAIVVSSYGFNFRSSLISVIPITTKNNEYPLHISVKNSHQAIGFACVEQLRNIDLQQRSYKVIGSADDSSLRTILGCLRGMFDLR